MNIKIDILHSEKICMQRIISICIALIILLAACKSKKKDLSGEEPVNVEDFIGFFQDITPPYAIADTQVNKRLPDSLLINEKVFSQFVPDTIYTNDYGKKIKPKFYALGKIAQKDKETYLFVKTATPEKQAAYILCFDKDNVFKTAMLLVKNNADRNKSFNGSIDKRLTITTTETKKVAGTQYYKLNAYVYNDVGVFTLLKIESNEPVLPTTVYNPYDTLPKKEKLSGDYILNKKNFVSIRDGKNAKHILFFVHFDTGKEECSGEIKGEAVLVKPNLAQYRQVGDPCVFQLFFSGNKVTIGEEQACGNYRGIKCAFEGTFTKKKEPAQKTKTGKK